MSDGDDAFIQIFLVVFFAILLMFIGRTVGGPLGEIFSNVGFLIASTVLLGIAIVILILVLRE
ncbi:hypothetical protein [Palaeococcus ferrophilus]|uniref:hypothetical protein n=1 Tax=Palaeococcus ferrophilus TaxID=83868 RepID=UPI00064FAF71|nr:hypothetical protein [Palaeococcus ferrophilus]